MPYTDEQGSLSLADMLWRSTRTVKVYLDRSSSAQATANTITSPSLPVSTSLSRRIASTIKLTMIIDINRYWYVPNAGMEKRGRASRHHIQGISNFGFLSAGPDLSRTRPTLSVRVKLFCGRFPSPTATSTRPFG
jgi:hypothetical protein